MITQEGPTQHFAMTPHRIGCSPYDDHFLITSGSKDVINEDHPSGTHYNRNRFNCNCSHTSDVILHTHNDQVVRFV